MPLETRDNVQVAPVVVHTHGPKPSVLVVGVAQRMHAIYVSATIHEYPCSRSTLTWLLRADTRHVRIVIRPSAAPEGFFDLSPFDLPEEAVVYHIGKYFST